MRPSTVPLPRRAGWGAVAMTVTALSLVSCGAGADPGAGGARGRLVVFAASSLTEVYSALGDAFMDANPGVEVTFNFASSSELAAQIAEGAPADVLATADATAMQAALDGIVAAGGDAPPPSTFATNSMEIVVAPGNPEGVAGLGDLAAAGLLVVLCADSTPCGRYAASILTAAGVALTPVSLEDNVKGVLSKVRAGEADAGIVYRTDVIAAGATVAGVEIPTDVNIVAEYPIAALHGDLAAAFVAFVLGADGRRVLEQYGFGLP